MKLRDFTLDHYEQLLDSALESGYTFYTLQDYLTRSDICSPHIVIRHDVDRRVQTALAMAHVEAERNISTTYYFRTSTFSPEIVQETEQLGHEVGYHYEDLVKTQGDFEEAHERFTQNLERFREYGEVQTICPHGSPLSSHHNLDMWQQEYDFESYGLIGDPYISVNTSNNDPEKPSYVSDTGRYWQSPATTKRNILTTDELIEGIRSNQYDDMHFLVHPGRWSRNPLEHIRCLAWDAVAELGKSCYQKSQPWITQIGK